MVKPKINIGTIKPTKPVRIPIRVRQKDQVTFSMPKGEVFVGSYHRISVQVEDPKLAFSKLRFEVPDGLKAGLISPSLDKIYNSRKPTIMLLVGYAPGSYEVLAINKETDAIVGRGKFTTSTSWKNDELGPSLWFTGEPTPKPMGAAWGGGTSGPQNVNVSPATGTRRVAVLFVDTSSQRFTTNTRNLAALQQRWMDEIFNGHTDGGVTRSSRLYFQEVSYGKFDLSAQLFGPVHLPDAFDDYFNEKGAPKGGYYQACITAADGLIDFTKFDTVLCVSQQLDAVGTDPARSAWPYASIGDWGPWTTAEGDLNFGVISMPANWGATGDRHVYETFSHEFGHNLGLGDQYAPTVPGRNLGGWDMMHLDDAFPHFTLVHRMILGWIPPGDVRAFDFKSMAAPVDQTVSLHPVQLGAPPAGKLSGVEIRIADGWNYYLEYRSAQTTQIGDQQLPKANRVLGTEAVSAPFTSPSLRPGVLLLHNDVDGDGAVLDKGQDYKETDTSDASYPTDFRIDVVDIDGTKADVRIRYGVNSRPDPSIRPWPAGPGRQWQSPDIEVRNAKNAVDPLLFNVPWEGQDNTVIARVKNSGGLDAPQVRVNFFVKDYTVGGVPETYLGTDVRDVAAGATVEFSSPWAPPSGGHYCVVVRIVLYQLPADLTVVEMTELNNIAQSNYVHFISKTSSPASRETTVVTVGNPYTMRTRIWLVAGQTNPHYRSYIQHRWVWLEPGETRRIEVMFEYAPEDRTIVRKVLRGKPGKDLLQHKRPIMKIDKMKHEPNDFSIIAFAEDPRDEPRHRVDLIGGAQARIVTGKATQFVDIELDPRSLRGSVFTVNGYTPVTGGSVIICFSWKKNPGKDRSYQTVELIKGKFLAILEHKGDVVQAFYVPAPGYGDCETNQIYRK